MKVDSAEQTNPEPTEDAHLEERAKSFSTAAYTDGKLVVSAEPKEPKAPKEPEAVKESEDGVQEGNGDEPSETEDLDEEQTKNEPPPEDKPKARNRTAEGRISQLIARNKQLERELASRAVAPTPQPAPQAATEPQPPRLSDYGNDVLDPGYIDAYIAYSEARAAKPAPAAAPAPTPAQADNGAALQERLLALADKGMEAADDYYDVVIKTAEAGDWPLPESVAALAADSEIGHLVLRKLAEDVGTAYKLARLSSEPLKQAVMFGRLEAELRAPKAAPPAPKPKQVKASSAPEAPRAQARGVSGQFTPAFDSTDFAAVQAAWKASQ